MNNATQFQTVPGFGNFVSNTGTTTQFPWGESTGYALPWAGLTHSGAITGQTNLMNHPVMQAIENGLGLGSQLGNHGIPSSHVQVQTLLQALFSETGLVLGPINGGIDSFLLNNFGEGHQAGAISSFMKLAQGVSSAQAIALTGVSAGHSIHANAATQALGSAFLTALIRVRYYDNNSTFVIGAEIAGGNTKNISVTVVGDEIRIRKTETGATGKNVINASNFGNAGAYFSLPLPTSADSKAITAVVKDGILTVTLQKDKEVSKSVHQVTVK